MLLRYCYGAIIMLLYCILGYDGAETVAELIPQYHPGLCHLEIKGNNIDSDGFEVIFAALANCPNLKSI